jgi:uncharacterized protein VirK/YbjX
MNHFLAERRKTEPAFFLAGDGVHPNEMGQWIIAREILLHWGAKDLAAVENAQAMLSIHPNGRALLKLIQQRQRWMKDAWLTSTGHQRPGMTKGLPLAQAQVKAADIGKQIRELARKRQTVDVEH